MLPLCAGSWASLLTVRGVCRHSAACACGDVCLVVADAVVVEGGHFGSPSGQPYFSVNCTGKEDSVDISECVSSSVSGCSSAAGVQCLGVYSHTS